MRATLPKDIVERFLDGPFHCEELRNRVSASVGEKLAGQDARGGGQPIDIGQIDKSEGEDEAVQQRRPLIGPTRNTSKSLTKSENSSTVGLPIRHHQHHANRLHETRNAGKKNRLICYRCGGKGRPARLCTSADDCQDVDEVGTEPST